MYSIYIHIPFCSYKCPYCDFNTYALGRIPEEEYVEALLLEISQVFAEQKMYGKELLSIYFGGGTPGIFSAESLQKILNLIKAHTSFPNDIEITVEANPKEIAEEKLRSYYKSGVNRLSIGAQSLSNKTLAALGRKHQKADVLNAVSAAYDAGFANISLDLMFAAPNQNLNELEQDIEDYLALNLPHISCYELTIEKGTPFYTAHERGNLDIVGDEQKLLMYQLIRHKLLDRGYVHYEISNFAKAGMESVHNRNYWRHNSYLGFGAGAHGCLHSGKVAARYSNIANYQEYISATKESRPVIAWSEEVCGSNLAFEYLMLSLRTKEGVSFQKLSEIAIDFDQLRLMNQLQELQVAGLLDIDQERFWLSFRGQEIADSVIEDLSKLF